MVQNRLKKLCTTRTAKGVLKMRARYQHVSIHEDLIKMVDEYITKSKKGYRSRAELISEAIRRLIREK